MLSEAEYQDGRRKGVGTQASVFRLGERVTGIAPTSKPAGATTYATAAIDRADKDQPPPRMPKDTGTAAPTAAGPAKRPVHKRKGTV
jgi:hypothetical protein